MARGDMTVREFSAGVQAEILNRKEFQATAMTIDFSSVTKKDDNGLLVVRAGTPVDKDGVPVTVTPWTGAIGIIKDDVYETRPQVAVLKDAYIHVKRAQANSGLTYDAALVAALNLASCKIVMEEPIIVAEAAASTGGGDDGE